MNHLQFNVTANAMPTATTFTAHHLSKGTRSTLKLPRAAHKCQNQSLICKNRLFCLSQRRNIVPAYVAPLTFTRALVVRQAVSADFYFDVHINKRFDLSVLHSFRAFVRREMHSSLAKYTNGSV